MIYGRSVMALRFFFYAAEKGKDKRKWQVPLPCHWSKITGVTVRFLFWPKGRKKAMPYFREAL
jgi:hypothetical protein